MKKEKNKNICGDCIHYCACASWNVGSIASMDGTNCTHFEKEIYKRGEWMLMESEDDGGGEWLECSVCGEQIDSGSASDYCPACGASMEADHERNG